MPTGHSILDAKPISTARLLLDTENPRLPSVQPDQVHALKQMIAGQGQRVLILADHIIKNGLNPMSAMMVIPAKDHQGSFIVLDGNRRFSALKALENPSIAQDVLPDAIMAKLKRLSQTFKQHPITDVACVIFPTRNEADPWIELIHRGAAQGAGLVAWDGQVAAAFDKRRGRRRPGLQIVDALKDNPDLSEQARQMIAAGKFPVTNLDRLVNTPYVRKQLGIEKKNGEIVATHPLEGVSKTLVKVIEDLATGGVTVSKIKSQEQRIQYINSLSQPYRATAAAALPVPIPITTLSSSATLPVSTAPKPAGPAGAGRRLRNTLIPSDCRLNIPSNRIASLFKELKRLNIDEFPNSGAIMLRVFIELSADYYLEHSVSWTEAQIRSPLHLKLQGCINDLETKKVMTSAELVPVRKAAAGQTLLASSTTLLHAYVHSRHVSPVASELRIAWDDLQPFLQALWKA